MEIDGLPGCSRDSEYSVSQVSAVSALAVCFCCLANNTPVIDATTCTHTEFVEQYFAEWKDRELAICYTCHYMLKKIELFRKQVRESLRLLSDYHHTKEQKLNRTRLVNNLINTDIVVRSNIKHCVKEPIVRPQRSRRRPIRNLVEEDSEQSLKKPRQTMIFATDTDATMNVTSTEHGDGQPTSNQVVEDNDDEPTERIEVASNLLEPASVVLNTKVKPRKKHCKTHYTTKRQKRQAAQWLERRKNEEKMKKKVFPPTDSITEEPDTETPCNESNTPINTKQSKTEEYFDNPKKYNGKIKVTYLTKNEVMLEREVERQKQVYLKKPYKCETCIRGFKEEEQYDNHMLKCHPPNRSDYETQCEVCDTVIKTMRGIRWHLKQHTRRFVCVACGLKTKQLESMTRHHKLNHVGRFKCKDCDKSFGKLKTLHTHKKHHHKKECEYCQKAFMKYLDLLIHYQKSHPDVYALKCEFCSEPFKSRQELYRHRRTTHAALIHRKPRRRYNEPEKDQNIIVIENSEPDYRLRRTTHSALSRHKPRRRYNKPEKDQNIIVIENSEQDSEETENNEHNIIYLENSENITPGDFIVMENVEPEVYVPENNDHDMGISVSEGYILGMENNEQNIAEADEPEVYVPENNYHKIEKSFGECDINGFRMENNEHNIVEAENNEHEEGVRDKCIDNMDHDIEYNVLGEKEDQNCIIGL